ncbi:huntingtin-interacting protein 1 isoform X2 [Macrosteles quadrilineatus]|uniref:huntingtin-interacting protein 1 isoform X2 n=1 Tax=Macrosteles quadrilineatus TaxID=74068 RepID=UPI0023E10DF4|nr:huntingtin-interacting protein 1 isoform X2 [Macrosteles quadrilineatus]
MSSLSLPRVLQQRKSSLEIERENFEKFQSASIGKAINQHESPVKEKHIRSAILGTFHEKCAETFWTCVLRLPLQENPIVAWKFCHVLHKVLREGHPQVIPNSLRHRSKLEDLGKLWGHLREGYGRLIQHYCKLLCVKLDFHRRNPRFPGNLSLSKDELEAIGDNDINNYFQMSVEMFDYMDEILALQAAVFGSLDMSRSNSMTSSGQCRLAPLIPVIQDSSQLYDFCVKILFRLHASLPSDVLSGHRQRFLNQFRELRKFYIAASMLQYFKNLIQIPSLPENPPNHLIQADLQSYVPPVVVMPGDKEPQPTPENPPNLLIQAELRSYVTPVVILPEEPPEEPPITSATADLVDISATNNHTNGSVSPDVLAQRDHLIEHLQGEVSRLRLEAQRLAASHQQDVAQLHELSEQLHERVSALETDLATKESELEHEKQQKEELLQLTDAAAKFHEADKKAKTFEEKFQKLKEVYSKLRDEHIQLIRQKADVDKQLATVKTNSLDQEAEKTRLEQVLEELASLQVSADTAAEHNQALSSRVEWVSAEKEKLENELQDLLSQKEDLDTRMDNLQRKLSDSQQQQTDLFTAMDDDPYGVESVVTESENIMRQTINELGNPAISVLTCTPGYLRALVPALESSINTLETAPTVGNIVSVTHLTAQFIILGKATSNTAHNIEFGDKMSNVCKELAQTCVTVLSSVRDSGSCSVSQLRAKLSELTELVHSLDTELQGGTTELIADSLETELLTMDKAIEEAARRIEEMLTKSRAADSGIKLEVNEKILDSCTTLMKAIRVLVQKSRLLQAEIVAQGKGTASAKEFYKRNHQWTEGLISAAKAVGMGANFLLTAADEVVSSGGKLEKLVVASQGIAASTAQLVVASRVKASRNSTNMSQLSAASKDVTQATAGVVATAKSCMQLVDESDELDVSHLSLHQAKRLEMEAQVRVLELESDLEKERLRLSALRRHHYQLAGDTDDSPAL